MSEAFADLRADFAIGTDSRYIPRLRGVKPMGSGADHHYRNEASYLKGVERARAFDRENMVVGQAVTRLIGNVLQDGCMLDPQTGSDELDAELKARWSAWSEDAERCDVAGEHDFHQMTKLTMRACIVDGDIFHLPLKSGKLESVEGHRLRTPRRTTRNVVLGVLLDNQRRRLEYWIHPDDIDPTRSVTRVNEIIRQPARDARGRKQVFHIYRPTRFSQTRGVTAFAPIVHPVGMHDDLQFAKLVEAQVTSCYAIIEEVEAGLEVLPTHTQIGSQAQEVVADGSTRIIEDIAPGMHIRGNPGVKIKGFSPNVPNPEFFQHAMLILSFIAINLGMPVHVLLLDPSKTNFSGWRGAIEQARIGFREMQKWLIEQWYRPVYLWKLEQWLRADADLRRLAGVDLDMKRLLGDAAVSVFRHRWTPPRFAYIEPNKDVQADERRLNANLISPRRWAQERGLDWGELVSETVDDRALMIETAIARAERINKANPDAAVDWRELGKFDPKGRKPNSNDKAMENLSRAVRSGVRITETEARVVLGLPADIPDGVPTLRFNDQDILGYHITGAMVKRSDVRERLKLPVDPKLDDVYIVPQGLQIVPASTVSTGDTADAGEGDDGEGNEGTRDQGNEEAGDE